LASLMRPLRPLPASCSWEEAATRRPEHQPQRSLRQSASVVSYPPLYSTRRDVEYRHRADANNIKVVPMIRLVKCRRLTATPAGAIAPHQIPIIRFEDLLQLLSWPDCDFTRRTVDGRPPG